MHTCIECLRKNGVHDMYCSFNTAIRNATRPDAHLEGEGKVIFTRTDGRKVTFDNVRVDSVGPNGSAPGVVSVEFFGNDDLVNVPFVESWVFQYRF